MNEVYARLFPREPTAAATVEISRLPPATCASKIDAIRSFGIRARRPFDGIEHQRNRGLLRFFSASFQRSCPA